MLTQFTHIFGSVPLLSRFDDRVVYIFLLVVILGVVVHSVLKKIKLNGSESDLLGKDKSYGLRNYTFNFSNTGDAKYESTVFQEGIFVCKNDRSSPYRSDYWLAAVRDDTGT